MTSKHVMSGESSRGMLGFILNFGRLHPSRFESFSYNNKDLLFEWVEEGALGSSNINNISLAQFNVFSGLVVIPTPIASLVYT